jgi:DNA mismatch repair protein MutS
MTPLMRQYWDIKALHEDKILFFRMGDFYEMFFDDAIKAAPILGIALTQRNKKSADETPMCGMPHFSIPGPINKLLKAGFKIAICDQIEDPKLAKGLVKRAVTRILTPGMVYDPETLEQNQSNYLASIESENGNYSLACAETSTGECFYFSDLKLTDIKRLLDVLPISEIVVSETDQNIWTGAMVSRHQDSKKHKVQSVGRLLSYIESLGGESALQTLKEFEPRSLQQKLELSSTSLRHLEIFATYKGEGVGSLYHAIDRTKTSGGARLLKQWLSFPLTKEAEILARQDHIEAWTQDLGKVKSLREVLAQMGDIERRLGKISQPQCNARDLLSLTHSVRAGLSALEIAQHKNSFAKLNSLAQKIEGTLVEEPPLSTKQGHMIKLGVDADLDQWIELSTNSQSKVLAMETKERESTGISSLKIRYNNVFGYFIEITNSHKDKVPAHYLRKQTLSNAERFCTDELLELEKKVLASQSRRSEIESEIFESLKKECLDQASELLNLAQTCSELDLISSLAWLAVEKKYVRPTISKNFSLQLRASRHAVVEQTVKNPFVPNDIEISANGCLLLTGPNMAGKSTLMRQIAVSAILHQIGSFVPADEARLPIFEHLFTRIGASDQLSEGLSTFMVEMTETAEMLQKSNEKSLLILDEIGRGTSTFDGMSLAQAILEYLLKETKAMTLFATHYHELTSLDLEYEQLENAHMTVSESQGEIVFLHTLTKGPAQKSYGIQVARLAGLPTAVTKRADELLKAVTKSSSASKTDQLSLLDVSAFAEPNPILEAIKSYPVTSKTPLEVMNQLAKWQTEL